MKVFNLSTHDHCEIHELVTREADNTADNKMISVKCTSFRWRHLPAVVRMSSRRADSPRAVFAPPRSRGAPPPGIICHR